MKHPFDTSKNFFTKIAAHKKKIAVLLIAVMILPYLTQTFLERQEQKREEKAVEKRLKRSSISKMKLWTVFLIM